MEDILPFYLAIGVSKERFMDGCPTDLRPYIEAQKMRQNMQDEQMWMMGNYVREAVSVSIENCFAKRPKAKYYKEPVLRNTQTKGKRRLTKSERKKGQERLLMSLKLMQSNFEMNHKK